MENRDASDDEDRKVLEPDRPHVPGTDDAQATRRGVLRRASALGVLPISGLAGQGRGDSNTTSSTDSPDRLSSVGVEPSLVFDRSFEVADEYSCSFDERLDQVVCSPAPGAIDDRVAGLVQVGDGGYVVAGGSSWIGGMWLIRTDAEGRPLFTRNYDLEGEYPYTRGITAGGDGRVVVLGESTESCWLRSIDLDGDICWVREYPEQRYADCNAITRTAEGGYAWVANSVLHVVDADGASRWRRSYTCSQAPTGGPQWDSDRECVPELSVVVPLDEGGFLLAGRFRKSLEESRVWVGRVDERGALLDDAMFEGSGYYSVFDAVPTGDGGMVLVGRFGDYGGSTTSPDTDILFLEVDSDLDIRTEGLRWDADGPDPSRWCGVVEAQAIVRTDGGFILAGRGGPCWFDPESGPDRGVALFVGLDRDGTVQWVYNYPEDFASAYTRDAVRTTDGGIAAVGYKYSPQQQWLVKLTTADSC